MRGRLALDVPERRTAPCVGRQSDPKGEIVTLDGEERGLVDMREIAEGRGRAGVAVWPRGPRKGPRVATSSRPHRRPPRRAASAEETDWLQVLAWYDELVALTADSVRQDRRGVGRAVAVGHVLGADAGLRETDGLRDVIGEPHRWHAVRGHLHEWGRPAAAANAYAEATHRATNVAERDHWSARPRGPAPLSASSRTTIERMENVEKAV